jgi:hypothetical protein
MTSSPCHCEERSNRTKAGNGCCCIDIHRRALGRAWPVTFVATKVTKKACSREASLRSASCVCPPHGLCPAKRAEPRAAIILPRFALAPASAKTCYAPAAANSQHCSARFHPKLICCGKHFGNKMFMLLLLILQILLYPYRHQISFSILPCLFTQNA